jgi:O-antigen/teichoic acid export membrane protein
LANSLFKNISKLLSANILVALVAALLSPWLTRLYTPEEFTAFAVFMTIAGILSTIATGRFEYAILLPKEENKAIQLVNLSFILALIVSFVSFFVLFLSKNYLSSFFEIETLPSWILWVPICVFLMAIFQILTAHANRKKRYTELASGQSILGLSNPLAKIGFALTKVVNHGLIIGFVVSNVLGAMFLSVFYLKNKPKISDKETLSNKNLAIQYKDFPLYNMPHALSNFVSGNLPFLMLIPAFGEYTLGLYSVAVSIVFKPISLLGNAVYQVFSQKTVENHHQKQPLLAETKNLLNKMILIGIVPFVIMLLFSPQIFAFIWGANYFEAGKYLRLILPWLFMVYLTSPISFIPNLFKQQGTAFAIDLLYLALRLLAIWIGVTLNSFEWAIGLFSGVGFVVLATYLLWCLNILKRAESGKLKIE